MTNRLPPNGDDPAAPAASADPNALSLVASCAFGLESVVARELQQLGYATGIQGPGQIQFVGDWRSVCHTNLWLRTADRVSIVLSEFPCADFDTLFEHVESIDWLRCTTADARLHVTGGSLKSQLTSIPAIQRTVKKAIVNKLGRQTGQDSLPETGPLYRVHIALRQNEARLSLDTTGPSLHKRGYREIATKAPLKETLAAALVQLSFWGPERPLWDPFCGGGTILIEAAQIGLRRAPGRNRTFSCSEWPQISPNLWREVEEEADDLALTTLPERLIGTDIHEGALSLARRNAQTAGVADCLHLQQRDFREISSRREYGCLITNPPYGDRLDPATLAELYSSMPLVFSRLPTWSHFILTAFPQFERIVGKPANRRRKLYNGRIACTYYQYHGPPPGRAGDTHPPTETTESIRPVFGGRPPKMQEQADTFRSRLRSRARHLRRWPTRRSITCYRLYERDVPEVPLIVDRYEDHLHIVEVERPHDRDPAQHQLWLDEMSQVAAEVMEIPPEHVHTKSRQRQRGDLQHEKLANERHEIAVREGDLQFLVNLTDYSDTGLFLDHRIARSMVREWSLGKRVLNLFAYTGSFSVYAAAGQATETLTVDWSRTYLEWAQRNFALNQLHSEHHQFLRSDIRDFVSSLEPNEQFDIIVCDPPTFSNSKRTDRIWDIQRDHLPLLQRLMDHLAADGTLLFSSNFRRLKFQEDAIPGARVREISKQTVPEDFRNRRIHRSWLIQHR